MADFFSGLIQAIVYQDATSEFFILKVSLDVPGEEQGISLTRFTEGKSVSVRGTIPANVVKVNSWLGFEAEWEAHPEYGNQLVVTKAPVVKEWTPSVAAALLAGAGVNNFVANSLRERFGESLVEVLNSGDSTKFSDTKLSKTEIDLIFFKWKTVRAYYRTLAFLANAGVSRTKISKVWSVFGDNAEEILNQNPWALIEIEGIAFEQADAVAMYLGLDLNRPERLQAVCIHVCKFARGMGHMYLTLSDVLREVRSYISEVDTKDLVVALGTCHKDGRLFLDRKTKEGVLAIYEPWFHQLESESADLLYQRVKSAGDLSSIQSYVNALQHSDSSECEVVSTTEDFKVLAEKVLDANMSPHMTLTKTQREAALNALIHPVSILTGLPGSGKTATLLSIVRTFQNANIRFLLIAPTGIAAKRMSSVTGAPAATVHRAFKAKNIQGSNDREATYAGIVGDKASDGLSADGSKESWASELHTADVVIVDESSMCDQHILYRILTCTKPTARLIFVGDAAQLPSVGAGNVLRDLISSKLFPTVALTEIFRQADTSQIVTAAHAINAGNVPELGDKSSSEFLLIRQLEEEKILDSVCSLAYKLYEKRQTFQVISPKHGGTLGVTSLNSRLREIINPRTPGIQELKVGSEVIREGDRIVISKNDYELGVFNGDMGKVSEIDRKSQEIVLKIHGPPAQYIRIPFKEAGNKIRLSYCITVHRSQGSEFDVVVMPIIKSFAHQLQRNLLYTAVTRAKKRVLMVGHYDALVKAVANNRVDERNTLFKERLQLRFKEAQDE